MLAVDVQNLTIQYGKLEAVKGISLQIPPGEVFGFIGPNGAGKSSTIRVLATLQPNYRGLAKIMDLNIRTKPQLVREQIGYVPDFFGVYEDLTVREYLHFFAAAYRLSLVKRKAVVDDVLQLTDLTGKIDSQVDSLSRGMKQRLSLARVLLHDPSVLLLDEPASGLDPRARIEMRELLKALKEMGKTIIISSHILHELAQLCTRIGIIEAGRMVAQGSVAEIYQRLGVLKIVHVQVAFQTPELIARLRELDGVTQVDDQVDRISIRFQEGRLEVEDLHDFIHNHGAKIRMFQPRSDGYGNGVYEADGRSDRLILNPVRSSWTRNRFVKLLQVFSLPLLTKELIAQAQNKRTYVLRVIYAVALYGLALLQYQLISGDGVAGVMNMGGGRRLFDNLVMLQSAMIFLLIPPITCGALTIEKEKDTLALLLLTKLSPLTIVFEKMLSRVFTMATYQLLSLPLFAIIYGIGGVDLGDIIVAIAGLASLTFLVASISILCSTWFRTTSSAFVWTYILLCLLSFGFFSISASALFLFGRFVQRQFFSSIRPMTVPECRVGGRSDPYLFQHSVFLRDCPATFVIALHAADRRAGVGPPRVLTHAESGAGGISARGPILHRTQSRHDRWDRAGLGQGPTSILRCNHVARNAKKIAGYIPVPIPNPDVVDGPLDARHGGSHGGWASQF